MKQVLWTSLIVLCEVFAFGAILPVLSDFNDELGGGALMVGVLFALMAAPKIFTNPLWGRWSDRLGRKPMFLIAGLGTITGSLLLGLSGSTAILLISRAVAGLFSGQATLSQSVVSDVLSPEKRAGAMGMLGAAFGLGVTLGPIAGGMIVEAFDDLAAVGWLCASVQGLGLLVALFLLKETRPQSNDDLREVKQAQETTSQAHGSTPAKARGLWSRLLPAALCCLVFTMGYSVMIPTFRRLTDQEFSYSIIESSYAFALFGFIGILVQGGAIRPTVKRLGESNTILLGLLLAGMGMLAMGLASGNLLLIGGLSFVAAGTSFAIPAMMSLMSQRAEAEEYGIAQGINQGSTAAGRTGSYLLAGALYQYAGPQVPFVSGAVLLILGIPFLFWDKVNSKRVSE